MVEVPYTAEYNVFAVDTQHFEQPECIINTCVVDKADSNVTSDSPDMCDNEIQTDHNDVECDNERVALANLIANLKLDIDENKTIQKQLKKANASLTQELKECKSTLEETSRTLRESNIVKEKHDELVKQSLLTKSHYEGLVKEKTKVITDLKLKEEKDIDKMILMENQLKFLNEIVYKRSHVIKPGMYRIASSTTQTRAPQLNQTSKNTNPCVSTSTGVAHKTNVSRPQC
ncbi:hypothetical protein Tco_1545732 [Tanacetum coccineum]